MKRMRMMGLCLVAAFALAAVGAGTASALPEVGRCVAKAGGKYKDANCVSKVTTGGTFEFVKSAEKVNFTSKGGFAELEGSTGTKVECTEQTATGKYDADGTPASIKGVESVVAKFNGCKTSVVTGTCQTKGAAAGEIVTNSLEGNLGYISKSKKEVGQELKPGATAPKGSNGQKLFVTFQCAEGALTVEVGRESSTSLGHDCLIAPTKPVNTMGLKAEQPYSGSGGKQEPEHFEGKTECNLESHFSVSSVWERSSQKLLTEVTNEEELETKA